MTGYMIGNASAPVSAGFRRNAMPGWDGYHWRGYMLFDTNAKTSWDLLDENTDAQIVIPTGYVITRLELRIPAAVLAGTNGDVLKLGTGATDTGAYILNTAAVGSGVLAAQAVKNQNASPFTSVFTTSGNLTLKGYLHNGSNLAPSGTLSVNPALQPTAKNPNILRVPVAIHAMTPTAILTADQLLLSRTEQQRDLNAL